MTASIPQLGEHTDTVPQVVATDDGIIDASADDGAEILDDGPECGVEVLESDTSTASHRPACSFE